MFNITDNFQSLTDEQLTEVTGGGTITVIVSGVNPALGSTTASAENFVGGTLNCAGTITTNGLSFVNGTITTLG